MRIAATVLTAGLLLGTSACGGGGSGTEAEAVAGGFSAAPTTTPSRTTSAVSKTTPARTNSTAPTSTPRPVPPAPEFIGGSSGLESLHTTALEVAGEEAWGHVVSVERLRDVVLMLRTDWTTATVDEQEANLVCAGVYTWMQSVSGYGSATGVTSRPFRTVGLYDDTAAGKSVFVC